MATNVYKFQGLTFVPNNHAAILSTDSVSRDYHMFQQFLADSEIARALIEPSKLCGTQMKTFWETGIYDDGGANGSPSIVFEHDNDAYSITLPIVREALRLQDHVGYTISVGDSEIRRMLNEIGYEGSLENLGQLKRPLLRKGWSFFVDCITRAFQKKCTNWDAIPLDSLQIGYCLIYGAHYDFARLIMKNIGEKMHENRQVVYFSRFCQLLFSASVDEEIRDNEVVLCFRLHKRVFKDLIFKDDKKPNLGSLLIPARVRKLINLPLLTVQSKPQPSTLHEESPCCERK